MRPSSWHLSRTHNTFDSPDVGTARIDYGERSSVACTGRERGRITYYGERRLKMRSGTQKARKRGFGCCAKAPNCCFGTQPLPRVSRLALSRQSMFGSENPPMRTRTSLHLDKGGIPISPPIGTVGVLSNATLPIGCRCFFAISRP